MGGDHKCPVCQATFTRPQHVARHMRSHTGDRPYKCQYCGDQFARSDLLARHINKCHANEKPFPNTVGSSSGRRKGSTATSRATTSKQACDQCVQSTLPCDGSNPCSKCVSRKSRCTYVKFHRQTAPSGPGHHPPRSPSSSSSSLSGNIAPVRLPSHLGTFPLPPSSSVPSMSAASFSGSEQIFNTPFTFNPGASTYPPNWTTADVTQLPFSMTPDADVTAKYRHQFDPPRRAGPPGVSSGAPPMQPNMYAAQQSQPPSSTWYPAWGESGPYPCLDDTKPFDGIARTHSLTSSEPTSFAPDFYGAGFIGSAYRPRRVSLDFSDSSSTTSQSVPSSATSSSVHLPLTGNEMYNSRPEEIQGQPHDTHILQHQRTNSLPGSQPSFSGPSDPPPQPHRVGEGGFSSAFGLMSIDDPNVLAGLSSDCVPFFSNLGVGILPHSPNATPMPTRMQHHPQQVRDRGMSLNALPTPGLTKDPMDSRELKDMWKTYLRSPLSGSGTATLDGSSFGQMPQSPSGQRRRVRVSSLPSVTPTMERSQAMSMNAHGEVGRSTPHGNPDDLKSYEAAVNARNTSLKLNLVPRRKGTRPNTSPGLQMDGVGVVGASASAAGAGVGIDPQGISRPSSSSSTSSFAQPFTMAPLHHHHAHAPVSGVVKPPPMQGASISLPIPPTMTMTGLHPHGHSHGHGHGHSHSVTFGSSTSLTYDPTGSSSRASSVTSDGTGTGGSGSDGEMLRPSFKRYPSQTLGPASSKRALVERGSGDSKRVSRAVDKGGLLKVEDRDEGRVGGNEGMSKGFERTGVGAGVGVGVGVGAGSPGSRPIAALPERAKRG